MKGSRCLAGLALLLSLAASATGAVEANGPTGEPNPLHGIWHNDKNAVHVEIASCGASECGRVVWATPNAQADARRGGTDPLIGARLVKNLKRDGNGVWRGKVFVPDINATFSGTAKVIGPDALRMQGCVFANLLCKTQVWTRVQAARPPDA